MIEQWFLKLAPEIVTCNFPSQAIGQVTCLTKHCKAGMVLPTCHVHPEGSRDREMQCLMSNFTKHTNSDNNESICNVGYLGSIPGLGRSPGGGHGNPLQYSCLENPHGQRSLVSYSPWSCKELDTTDQAQHSTPLGAPTLSQAYALPLVHKASLSLSAFVYTVPSARITLLSFSSE